MYKQLISGSKQVYLYKAEDVQRATGTAMLPANLHIFLAEFYLKFSFHFSAFLHSNVKLLFISHIDILSPHLYISPIPQCWSLVGLDSTLESPIRVKNKS